MKHIDIYSKKYRSAIEVLNYINEQHNGLCTASLRTIAKDLGKSHSYLYNLLIPLLVQEGLIIRTQSGKYNRITLTATGKEHY